MPGIGKRCTSDEYVAFSSAPKNNTAIFFKNHLKKKKKAHNSGSNAILKSIRLHSMNKIDTDTQNRGGKKQNGKNPASSVLTGNRAKACCP